MNTTAAEELLKIVRCQKQKDSTTQFFKNLADASEICAAGKITQAYAYAMKKMMKEEANE